MRRAPDRWKVVAEMLPALREELSSNRRRARTLIRIKRTSFGLRRFQVVTRLSALGTSVRTFSAH